MKVKELIEKLSNCNEEDEVILYSFGNDYGDYASLEVDGEIIMERSEC